MPNGNKFKGNKGKKGRRRKNPYADFDEKTDQYAKVLSMQGGKHMTVQPLDNPNGETVSAIIKGSHHRKIWYRKDELIVIRTIGQLVEVQGKVPMDEINSIRQKFDMLEGGDNCRLVFGDVDNVSDSDDDNGSGSGTRSAGRQIPAQPIKDFSILNSPAEDAGPINIDDI